MKDYRNKKKIYTAAVKLNPLVKSKISEPAKSIMLNESYF